MNVIIELICTESVLEGRRPLVLCYKHLIALGKDLSEVGLFLKKKLGVQLPTLKHAMVPEQTPSIPYTCISQIDGP